MDQVAVYARGLTRVRVGSDVRLLPRSAVSCSSFDGGPDSLLLLFSCFMSPTESDLEGFLGVIVLYRTANFRRGYWVRVHCKWLARLVFTHVSLASFCGSPMSNGWAT